MAPFQMMLNALNRGVRKGTEIQLRQEKKTKQTNKQTWCTVVDLAISQISQSDVSWPSLWWKMLTVSAFLTHSGRESHSLGMKSVISHGNKDTNNSTNQHIVLSHWSWEKDTNTNLNQQFLAVSHTAMGTETNTSLNQHTLCLAVSRHTATGTKRQTPPWTNTLCAQLLVLLLWEQRDKYLQKATNKSMFRCLIILLWEQRDKYLPEATNLCLAV